MILHEYEKLRELLIQDLGEFIARADITLDGNHPYWDDDIVEAMADAALAVVRAADVAEQNAYQAA